MGPFLRMMHQAQKSRQKIQPVLMVLNLLNSRILSRDNYMTAFHEWDIPMLLITKPNKFNFGNKVISLI